MQHIKQILDSLKAQDNYRVLRDFRHCGAYLLDSKEVKLLNLASNDYLGIASDEKIVEKFYKWCEKRGFLAPKESAKSHKKSKPPHKDFAKFLRFSSSSSRLLSGGFPAYEAFEAHLDSAFSPKKSLLFNSGYHLNISTLQALSQLPHSLFLLDFYSHASVIDGVRLGGADFKRFRHNDISHLSELLESRGKNYKHIFIVSEGVFSMEGDFAFLEQIIALKEEHKKRGKNVYIYLDEAHSVGVFGRSGGVRYGKDLSDFGIENDGLGLARALGVESCVDFLVFTFGKAIGSVGACVICHKDFRDFFVNSARGLIYSSALPPINVAFSYFVFEILGGLKDEKKLAKSITKRRENLALLSEFFRDSLEQIEQKYCLKSLGKSHIFSLILGENSLAISLAKKLESSGIYAPAIKSPTVPKGSARIRFSLSASMSLDETRFVIEELEKHLKTILKSLKKNI